MSVDFDDVELVALWRGFLDAPERMTDADADGLGRGCGWGDTSMPLRWGTAVLDGLGASAPVESEQACNNKQPRSTDRAVEQVVEQPSSAAHPAPEGFGSPGTSGSTGR